MSKVATHLILFKAIVQSMIKHMMNDKKPTKIQTSISFSLNSRRENKKGFNPMQPKLIYYSFSVELRILSTCWAGASPLRQPARVTNVP